LAVIHAAGIGIWNGHDEVLGLVVFAQRISRSIFIILQAG